MPSTYCVRSWRAICLRQLSSCFIPYAFDAPFRGFLSEYCHPVWCGETRMVGLSDGEKKCEDVYNRFDRIPACDRQTDGQTSCDGIVRAMHTRYTLNQSITKYAEKCLPWTPTQAERRQSNGPAFSIRLTVSVSVTQDAVSGSSQALLEMQLQLCPINWTQE